MDWLPAILSAAFAAGGAYMAVRVELKFLWRDLTALGGRVKDLESRR